MNTNKDIYTVIEAATLFNKSPNLIYKELKKHKLNSIGRQIRIHRVALQDYLIKQQPATNILFERI